MAKEKYEQQSEETEQMSFCAICYEGFSDAGPVRLHGCPDCGILACADCIKQAEDCCPRCVSPNIGTVESSGSEDSVQNEMDSLELFIHHVLVRDAATALLNEIREAQFYNDLMQHIEPIGPEHVTNTIRDAESIVWEKSLRLARKTPDDSIKYLIRLADNIDATLNAVGKGRPTTRQKGKE
jgi:hypothetical protein